jgi:hypothetical protein
MFDDPGDIDRNGIPDSIQRDPVVAPGEEDPFDVFAPDPGPAATQATANAPDPLSQIPALPEPPTMPPADADEATMLAYQREMQRYQEMMQLLSNVLNTQHEAQQDILRNIRG